MKNARIIAILVAMVMFSTTLFAQVSSNDDIAGSYKMQENPYVKAVKFAVKEGKVIMSAEGFPDTEIAKGKNADEFVIESQNGVITFTRDGGKVKGVKIEAQGVTLAGEKEGASSSSSMGDYAATFKMSDNEYVKKIKIDLKDGKLMLSSDSNPTEGAVLKASNSADVFTTSIQGYDADIIFSRAGGKVSSIKLSVAGGQVVLTGEKEQ
jgi:HSP20 family molecular chaperone IbpA